MESNAAAAREKSGAPSAESADAPRAATGLQSGSTSISDPRAVATDTPSKMLFGTVGRDVAAAYFNRVAPGADAPPDEMGLLAPNAPALAPSGGGAAGAAAPSSSTTAAPPERQRF